MKLFIIVFLVCVAMVTSEDAKKRWKIIKKEEKKIEEKFKVGDVVIEITTQLHYIVIDEKEMEYKVPKGQISVKQIKNGLKYIAYPEEIRKATKIEEFIFKNGGKENE